MAPRTSITTTPATSPTARRLSDESTSDTTVQASRATKSGRERGPYDKKKTREAHRRKNKEVISRSYRPLAPAPPSSGSDSSHSNSPPAAFAQRPSTAPSDMFVTHMSNHTAGQHLAPQVDVPASTTPPHHFANRATSHPDICTTSMRPHAAGQFLGQQMSIPQPITPQFPTANMATPHPGMSDTHMPYQVTDPYPVPQMDMPQSIYSNPPATNMVAYDSGMLAPSMPNYTADPTWGQQMGIPDPIISNSLPANMAPHNPGMFDIHMPNSAAGLDWGLELSIPQLIHSAPLGNAEAAPKPSLYEDFDLAGFMEIFDPNNPGLYATHPPQDAAADELAYDPTSLLDAHGCFVLGFKPGVDPNIMLTQPCA